jgi:hypothetical protein
LRILLLIFLASFLSTSLTAADPPANTPAGTSPWSAKKFLHPPLKCMEPYTRIDEYPVLAWAFHGKGSPGYNEEFVRQAEMSGFNVLIDAAVMLKPSEASKNMKVVAVVFRFPPERIKNEVFDKFGDHPRLLGLLLDDNCPRIYQWSITASNWMRENYPHLAPWVSENPDPRGQSRTAIRILGTQNYHVTRAPGPWGRQAYCSTLGRDRDNGNAMNMTFWPLLSSPAAPGAVRFEAFAAAAHGAQGVCYFAYCPGDRWPEWKAPQGAVAQAAAEANNYLRNVAGWHIWGTRCRQVLHGPRDADVPQNAGRAAPGEIIETMDDSLLAGLLLPEKEFLEPAADGEPGASAPGGISDKKGTVAQARTKLPMYAFVVDKRYEGPRRTVHVQFSADVASVEVFPVKDGADSTKEFRRIEPGWSVPLELNSGSGLLLRLNPPDVDALFSDQAREYTALVNAISGLREQMRQGSAAADDFNRVLAKGRGTLLALRKQVQGKRQQTEILDAWDRGLNQLRISAVQPTFATAGEPFAGSVSVELKSQVRGSDIRFTLDGSEPTLNSPRYSGPLELNRTTTIRARGAAADPVELIGEEIRTEFTLVKADLAQPHRIIFQPRDAAPAPLADHGDAYGARSSGFAYGWDRDLAKLALYWNDVPDAAQKSGLQLKPGAVWQHLVPNGRYDVTLSLGSGKHELRDAIIMVEGEEIVGTQKNLKAGQFETVTKTVTVNDGKLTLSATAPKAARRRRVQFAATLNLVEIRKSDPAK